MSERREIWGLRLLALVVALVIWFFVSVEKREPLSERVVEATVTYNAPVGWIILDPLEKVRVRIRGTTSRIRNVNPFMVDAFVEIRSPEVGTREVLLGPENLIVPEDIEVASIEPTLIRVTIDREVTELLPVRPRLDGEPAAGAIVRETRVEPGEVLVRGPAERIGLTAELATTPVDLTGHALDFSERAAVVAPDPLIKIVEPVVVTVTVSMTLPNAPGSEPGDEESTR